ncbi:F-box domain-containing protein [Heracleum sosnowskyi]|uniref:F-box domain-containing protein n=1 Tax=Heracleum sosnowskyi TaxID=360622 RepID=A0AAD8IKM4_9APIA|nr:F-box domain-containing protein [Heracleum sosnowskyi]
MAERLREEDLLIEVLSRLDVKTLLQCKSVSKPWYSLISTPVFMKSHLNRALNGADNQTANLIVRRRNKKHGSFSLFQLGGCDELVANLDFPYSKGDYVFTPPSMVIGCVCGIVCVYVASVDANQVKERTDIYIWNPAIKQSKLIPAHTFHHDNATRAFGFGYDPIDFDFKVVRVLSKAIFPEVYSLNRNVWRKIETKLSDTPNREIFEIFLHGFLFTIGLNGMMMAFDLNREVFVCDIELPARSDDACLADFKDSIAVILSNFGEDMINLWTLDDEACLRGVGVEASWTMMLTIDVGVRVDWVYGIFNTFELLLSSGDWFSYNLDKKVGRYLGTDAFFDCVEVFKYTESLVPVAGSKLVNWSDDVDDNEESSTDSEEVSEESSVDLEDGNERSSVGIGSEDDNEKSTVGLEDDEESSGDFEDANEEISADSGDE